MDDLWHHPATVLGFAAGLVLGLGWSLIITWRIVRLGAVMGHDVMQARRLSAHTSREYQNLKQRVERLERRVRLQQGDDLEEGG